MTKILVLFVLLGFSACQTAEQIQKEYQGGTYSDQWLGDDKFKHFTASAFIGTTTGIELQRFHSSQQDAVAVGVLTSFSVGLAKEIYDGAKPDNHFCYKDLTWDLLGIGLSVILLNRNF